MQYPGHENAFLNQDATVLCFCECSNEIKPATSNLLPVSNPVQTFSTPHVAYRSSHFFIPTLFHGSCQFQIFAAVLSV
jgi:hypothetical protein